MKTNSNLNKRAWVLIVLIGSLFAALAGCGGGSGSASSVGQGHVQLLVQWPAPTRYIPPYAKSVRVSITSSGGGGLVASAIANRPEGEGETHVLLDLTVPVGSYLVKADAFTDFNAVGSIVATANAGADVAANAATSLPMSLGTTIDKIELVGSPYRIGTGNLQQFTAVAKDSENNILLLPENAFNWSVKAGTAGYISPTGLFTATGVGVVELEVREPGANVSALGAVSVFAVPANTLWSTARRSSQRTGLSEARSVMPNPAVRNSVKAYDASTFPGESPVVSQNGYVITVGDPDVQAYDPLTGNKQWQADIGPGLLGSAVAVKSNLLYVTGAGKLFELEAASGSVLRQLDIPGGQASHVMLLKSGFLVVNGVSATYGIDSASMQIVWTGPETAASFSRFAEGNQGQVFFYHFNGSAPSDMVCLNGSTGVLIWTKKLNWTGGAGPVCSPNGLVYATDGSGLLVAFNQMTGAEVWRRTDIGGAVNGSPLVTLDNRIVYGAPTQNGSIVKCLDALTGAQIWEQPGIQSQSLQYSSPIATTDGEIYISGSFLGTPIVYILSLATGSIDRQVYLSFEGQGQFVTMGFCIPVDGVLVTLDTGGTLSFIQDFVGT